MFVIEMITEMCHPDTSSVKEDLLPCNWECFQPLQGFSELQRATCRLFLPRPLTSNDWWRWRYKGPAGQCPWAIMAAALLVESAEAVIGLLCSLISPCIQFCFFPLLSTGFDSKQNFLENLAWANDRVIPKRASHSAISLTPPESGWTGCPVRGCGEATL